MSVLIPLRPKAPAGSTIEQSVLCAVLNLDEKLQLMEAMGLGRDDFQDQRMGLAWLVSKTLLERRLELTPMTICARGARANLLADDDLRWLIELSALPPPSREQALQLAEEVRIQSRARHVRAQLMSQVETIDRGRFHPGITTGALESIIHGLATDFAPNETADADLLALNATWDSNVSSGRSNFDPTGIRLLDELIGGHPKNIFFIHGPGGVGKNAYTATVIKSQLLLPANATSRTGLVGLESGTKWLTNRWQAEGLGIPIREVGSRRLTPEQLAQKTHLDEQHYALLKRVEIFRGHGINRGELQRRIMRWIFQDGVDRVYLDNFREIRHRDPRVRNEAWEAAAETVRVLRDMAEKYGIPIGVLIHDNAEAPTQGHERPPNPKEMQGGQDAGARARLVLGMWRKGNAIRMTVTKANDLAEAGPDGPTIEFQRNFEAGTFSPDGGRLVDLNAEAKREHREKKERDLEDGAHHSIRRAALVAKLKGKLAPAEPPKPVVPPPQASLLDVPTSKKPEPV